MPLRVHTALRQSPLLAAGVVVLAWLLASRLRGRTRTRVAGPTGETGTGTNAPTLDVAGIEIVSEEDEGGWRGRILDAHDKKPIPGAEIVVERGGFTSAAILTFAQADADGRFVLPGVERVPGDVLVVQGRLHDALRQPLPRPGELAIQLVSRRRALLDRLVGWARVRMKDVAKVEPTPAQIRRRAHDFEVKRWAEAVERAAYGPGEVDEVVERDVDHLAPKPKER